MSDVNYVIAFALLGLTWLVLRSMGTREHQRPRRWHASALVERDD